jgi:hypothetical protein
MPIALVPEGFTLKKVTKLQEQALKDHRKHEDFKAFLGSSGSGKGMGLGLVAIVSILFIVPMLINMLKKISEDEPNMTITQFIETEPDFVPLYLRAFAGIPETLQNVIIPEPIRDEIKARTGFDLDVGNIFAPFFEATKGKE